MNKLIIPSKTERLIQKNDFFLTRSHDFVEIGGVKWATCNIGAKKPTDLGLYFQWGNTKGYTAEEIANMPIDLFSSCGGYKPIFGQISYEFNQYRIKLKCEYDAAHANWGGAWKMPTTEDFMKLKASTKYTWIRDYKKSGISGLLFTDRKDNSKELFFPAAGYARNKIIGLFGVDGSYWASDNVIGRENVANTIVMRDKYDMKDSCIIRVDDDFCFLGFPIRAILN